METSRSDEPRRERLVARVVRRVEGAVPAQYQLAFELMRHRWRDRLEAELLGLEVIAQDRVLAIDIGANRGYYTYTMSRIFDQVVAFEPNESTLARLRAARLSNVTVHAVALSAGVGSKNLYIPAVGGVVHDGWASFNPANLPEATGVEGIEVPVTTLDSFSFPDVSFIKIDVEGHELSVLRGGSGTIDRCRPIVLSEVKPAGREAVFEYFSALDYDSFQFVEGQLTPFNPTGPAAPGNDNFVFRPRHSSPTRGTR